MISGPHRRSPVSARARLERDRLVVLARVRAEHEVGVAPGGLGGLHLEGVVVVALYNRNMRNV